jgi:hypothetical protein
LKATSAQLELLHKHQHAAETGLQKRLAADVEAITRLGDAWIAHVLERKTKAMASLVVEDRRAALAAPCRQLVEPSINRLGKTVLFTSECVKTLPVAKPPLE